MLPCRCVTPHIIIPSSRRWSRADLEYHANVAVSSCVINSGHNCLSTELIVTAKHWPQREEFLEAVRKVLNSMSQRWPWYPGSMVCIHASLLVTPCFRIEALHLAAAVARGVSGSHPCSSKQCKPLIPTRFARPVFTCLNQVQCFMARGLVCHAKVCDLLSTVERFMSDCHLPFELCVVLRWRCSAAAPHATSQKQQCNREKQKYGHTLPIGIMCDDGLGCVVEVRSLLEYTPEETARGCNWCVSVSHQIGPRQRVLHSLLPCSRVL
jgi:hypothetical protein